METETIGNMSAENTHGILSDIEILQRYQKGEIVIHPFVGENIKTSSVDVRLGKNYFRPRKDHGLIAFDPWDKTHTKKIYGEPHVAKKAIEEYPDGLPSDISPDQEIIILNPGEILLCHTEEYIGGVNETTTMMKARSSIGRCDISVCQCAGWGDVGYFNRWTMEIRTNGFGSNLPVILRVGHRLAQITFFDTGPTNGAIYSLDGKYQTSSDLQQLEENWHPNMMLPQLSKDKEVQK